MYVRKDAGPVAVTLPDGSTLSRSDLPERNTTRWVARRKATVVTAVVAGLISAEEACEMYDLSKDELNGWIKAVRDHGTGALRVTALQKYRDETAA
ncbi:MAG: DUF1153 domain-containing protein [Pseudomonadota bacterium]